MMADGHPGVILSEALAALDDETKAVCAAWFGMMLPNKGELVFGMKEHRPSARAQAALDRLLEAGIVGRREAGSGVVYVPAVDCSPLMAWFAGQADNPAFAFPLTEKIAGGSGRTGFRMEVEGSPEAIAAARKAVEYTEAGVAGRTGQKA